MRAVRQLAAFYRPTPNQFNEEQLREYYCSLGFFKALVKNLAKNEMAGKGGIDGGMNETKSLLVD